MIVKLSFALPSQAWGLGKFMLADIFFRPIQIELKKHSLMEIDKTELYEFFNTLVTY